MYLYFSYFLYFVFVALYCIVKYCTVLSGHILVYFCIVFLCVFAYMANKRLHIICVYRLRSKHDHKIAWGFPGGVVFRLLALATVHSLTNFEVSILK